MIAKSFIFSFINSYASFFFIAYFAAIVPKPTYPGQPDDNTVGMCGFENCMTALAIDLGIVLLSNSATSFCFVLYDRVSYKITLSLIYGKLICLFIYQFICLFFYLCSIYVLFILLVYLSSKGSRAGGKL